MTVVIHPFPCYGAFVSLYLENYDVSLNVMYEVLRWTVGLFDPRVIFVSYE